MHARSPQTRRSGCSQVVRGYFQYHAIPGNWERLKAFRHEVLHMWCQALRRRSQRSRLTGGVPSRDASVALLPPVQILQPYPERALRRQTSLSKVRTVCVSSASTGLCGGQRATAVPTATKLHLLLGDFQGCLRLQ